MPFDVEAVQPDALICATYKWLLGPYSVSLAYFGPRFDDDVPLEDVDALMGVLREAVA